MINITDKKKCTGCGACAQGCPQNCIIMQEDEEGFLYPHINKEKCIGCNVCERICKTKMQINIKYPDSTYAIFCRDEVIRTTSSSGGVFSLLAEYVLNNNGVVFGAYYNDRQEVVHGYINCKEKIGLLRGSKYVQSNLENSYQQAKAFLVLRNMCFLLELDAR